MNMRNISKILLINPPGSIFVQSDGSKQVKECPPPLGLAYLTSQIINKCNCEVRVYDMVIENYFQEIRVSDDTILYGDSFEQYSNVLKEYKPDLVGISCLLSSRSASVLELCRITKEFDQSIITAVGGHHATSLPEHVLQDNTEIVFLGEADFSFPEFVNAVNSNRDISSIDGIVYRDREGRLVVQEKKDYVKDIDALARPAWEIVGLEKYWIGQMPYGGALMKKKYGVLNTSRGCPHVCDYCAVPKHCGERNFRARSLNDVIDEIKWLVNTYGVEEIVFMDDNFFVNKKRIKAFLKLLISHFPGMYFAVPTGTDLPFIDLEIIDLLKRAGFYHMWLGIETGAMDIQGKFVDKRIDIQDTRGKIKYMKEVGLKVAGFFLMGFPEETRDSIMKTVELSTSLDLDRIYLIMVAPLPGSRLYDYCLKHDLLYDDFDITKVRFSNTFIKNSHISRTELESIRRNVWKEYMSKRIDIEEYHNRDVLNTSSVVN